MAILGELFAHRNKETKNIKSMKNTHQQNSKTTEKNHCENQKNNIIVCFFVVEFPCFSFWRSKTHNTDLSFGGSKTHHTYLVSPGDGGGAVLKAEGSFSERSFEFKSRDGQTVATVGRGGVGWGSVGVGSLIGSFGFGDGMVWGGWCVFVVFQVFLWGRALFLLGVFGMKHGARF